MRQPGEPVPNQPPTCPSGEARIAIVGECPGRDENFQGLPFVGTSGVLLDSALGHVGVSRAQCFVGNVCQSFPGEGRDFNSFAWEGQAVQAGIAQLALDLEAFNPTMVLCLGNAALHLMKQGNVAPPKRGGQFDWPCKVGDWRGSLFGSRFLVSELCGLCDGQGERLVREPPYDETAKLLVQECCDCKGTGRRNPLLKCLAAYHPAAVAREQSLQAYYRCAPGVGDLERLREECRSRELVLPGRDIIIADSLSFLSCLEDFRVLKKPVSIDCEGYPGNLTAIAFSIEAGRALVIPLAHIDGTSVWSEADEVAIWQAVKELLEDEQVVKIGQNFSYDSFALAWTYGITTRGQVWDTLELWWECFPELDKGLDVQASLLTREQFYKPDKHREDGKTTLKFASDEEFWRYNGLDACVTFECWEREMELLRIRARQQQGTNGLAQPSPPAQPTCLTHAAFNSSLFAPAKLYPMLRGIKVDEQRVEDEKEKAGQGVWELQAKINDTAADPLWRELQIYTDVQDEQRFAQLCLACLGGKNPRQRVEVVEERWQPMRWEQKLKGKEPGLGKWKRAGKLVTQLAWNEECLGKSEPPKIEANGQAWYKPVHKTVSCLQPFTPATLAEVEPHLLKEGQAVWKRVKQIWKELKTANCLHVEWKGIPEVDAYCAACGKDEMEVAMEGVKHEEINSQITSVVEESFGKGMRENRHERTDVSIASSRLGELSTLLGLSVNISSTSEGGDAQWFLFEVCGLPKIYKDQRTGKYSRESESEWKKRTKGLKQKGPCSAALEEGTNEGMRKNRPERIDVFVREPGRITKSSKRLSTDQQALAKLYAATQDVRVLWALQQRRLRMVVSDLSKEFDADGRVRSSISLVKETGRMAASKSPLGTGTNLMALNKDLLRICVADEGCELGKFDLEGADSWTVAAECAALGDPTMLLDLKEGLKPAQVICLIYLRGESINRYYRAEIKKLWQQEKRGLGLPDWLYPAAKSTIHGYCYGSGWETTRDTILKYSMADLPLELGDAKPIVLSKAEVEKLRAAAASRYPGIKLWHAAEGKALLERGWLDMSTGHRRLFFGRKAEWKHGHKMPNHDTLKEWLASKPQYYTTFVVKKALEKLWYDPDNRQVCGTCLNEGGIDSGGSNPDGSWISLPCPDCDGKAGRRLRVEPLMARHDELLVQWRVEDRAWALEKMKEYFATELMIAGQYVVIPVEGKVGTDWGMK